MLLTNNFEGGTNTTTISTVNSGGASGYAFDSNPGTAPTFSNTQTAHGGMAMAPVTSAQSMVSWGTKLVAFGAPTEFWARFSFFLTGTASTNVPIMYHRDQTDTNNLTGIRINTGTTGIGITANGSTAVTNLTNTVPLNTWVRFEMHSLISGGNATCDVQYFASLDSMIPTETQTITAATAATGFGSIRMGNNVAQTTTFWYDDLAASTTGWIGPVDTLGLAQRPRIWLGGRPQRGPVLLAQQQPVAVETSKIRFVQRVGGGIRSASGTTITITPGANCTAGNTVIMHACGGGGQALTSITDTKSNTWTVAADAGNVSSRSMIYYTQQNGGALTTGDTITVTYASALANAVAHCFEFSGISSTSPIDTPTASAGTVASTTTPSATTAAVLADPGDLVVATFSWQFSSTITGTTRGAYAGYEIDENANGFLSGLFEFYAQNSWPLTTQTATALLSGTPTALSLSTAIVAFKPPGIVLKTLSVPLTESATIALTNSTQKSIALSETATATVAKQAQKLISLTKNMAGSPIAYVQEVGKQAAGVTASSVVVTLSASAALGHLIIARAVCASGQNVSSVTDSRGNTWTVDVVGSAGPKVALASTGQNVAALQSGDTVTVNFSGSANQSAAIIDEFSGLDTSASRVDKTATGTATGTSRDAGTTATTTQADELVVGCFGGGALETTFTPGAGFTRFTTDFLNDAGTSVEGEYQIVSATGAYQPTATGASFPTDGVVATYKGGGGGSALSMTFIKLKTLLATITQSSSLAAPRQTNKTILLTETPTLAPTKTITKTAFALAQATVLTVKKSALKAIGLTQTTSLTATMHSARVLAVSLTQATTLAITKTPQKAIALTQATALTITKQAKKSLALTEAATMATIRSLSRTIALSETATLTALKLVSKPISLTQAATVAVTKSARKTISLSETASFSPAFLAVKTLVIALTQATTLAVTKTTKKTIGVTQASSLAAIRQAQKLVGLAQSTTISFSTAGLVQTLSVALSQATALATARQAQKAINLAQTSAISTKNAIAKSVALTATAALSVVKLITRPVIALTQASSLTPFKQPQKSVTVTQATLVAATKTTAKIIPLTPAVSLISTRSMHLGVNLTAHLTYSAFVAKGGGGGGTTNIPAVLMTERGELFIYNNGLLIRI